MQKLQQQLQHLREQELQQQQQSDSREVKTSNPELDEKINEWLAWDQNEKTAGEIRRLVREKQFEHLEKILMTRLKFGTAGLRGKLGVGYNAMNDLVVLQTAQGILKYLEEGEILPILQKNGIVVGYDARHGSKRFAEITATVFVQKGYQVKLFNNVVPTPFVSFATGKYKCAIGIMVTASHNPKEDNGYKVYGSNGAQIVSPVDAQIESYILQNLEPLETSWDTSILSNCDKKSNPLPDVLKSYLEMIKTDIAEVHRNINAKSNLIFTYTAMHGVGYIYFARAMEVAGLKIVPVDEQKYPDPNFPTVKYPNPEEGKNALDLAIKTAEAFDSKIIIANDPDADRMAAAEKTENGDWRVFTGNELGALLGWWALHSYQASAGYDPKADIYMLSSSVSSKILRTMAKVERFRFIETLTGFKWMGNKTHELMQNKKKVIFAFEEAIGYMWNPLVLDKDGIQAGIHLATMAAYLNHYNMSLEAQLKEIYQQYGYHITNNSYLLTNDVSVFDKIFHKLRNFKGENTYPTCIGGKYHIKNVRDLTTGYDSSTLDKKSDLPSFPDQQMITFDFTNGLVATLRTSGTEPKLKYYMEMCAKPKQGTRDEIETLLADMVYWLVLDLCEPEKNGLTRKPA